MKKFASLMIALALCMGLAVPAMAAGTTETLTSQGITASLTNVLSKETRTVSMKDRDPVMGEEIVVNQEITIYHLPETGGRITISGSHEEFGEDYFPGYAEYACVNGVYDDFNGGQMLDGPGYWDFDGSISESEFDEVEGTVEDYLYQCGLVRGEGPYFFVSFDGKADDGQTDKPTVTETPAEPAAPAVGGFGDVKEDDYFAQPVLWAVENGVTSGTSSTTFSPDDNCTVAQILTFLSRAQGSPEPAGTASLPGVDAGAYYYKPAVWALEQGLTDSFSADDPCTRSMVVTYLWKLAGSPAAGTSSFTDVSADAAYSQAVTWAVEQGITAGTSDTTFSPDETCTRGQIVTFLYRAFVK